MGLKNAKKIPPTLMPQTLIREAKITSVISMLVFFLRPGRYF